jgi:hypothetical protein
MSKRFNDVDVQVAISGNEFPKLLPTEFEIIALVWDTCLAITASIYSDNGLFADICSENPFRFPESYRSFGEFDRHCQQHCDDEVAFVLIGRRVRESRVR